MFKCRQFAGLLHCSVSWLNDTQQFGTCLSLLAVYKPYLEMFAFSSDMVLHSYDYISSGWSRIPIRQFRAWADWITGKTCSSQLTEVQLLFAWYEVYLCFDLSICWKSFCFFFFSACNLWNKYKKEKKEDYWKGNWRRQWDKEEEEKTVSAELFHFSSNH